MFRKTPLRNLVYVTSKVGTRQVRLFNGTKFVQEDGQVPWYLRPEESPTLNSPLNKVELPELPHNSPATLQPILEFIGQELGLFDLKVFDLRTSKSNEGAIDLADYMIIGTGKSPKHIQKASSELNFFIKEKYHKLASTEGILRSGIIAKYNRRLQKKGKKAPAYSQNDFGASPNTWVMTDCKSDGIVVHFLTKERRNDLNLEELWSPDDVPKQESRNVESDDIFKGIRYFHTSRRTQFDELDLTIDNYSTEFNKLCFNHLTNSDETPLFKLHFHLDKMQRSNLQVSLELIKKFMNVIIQSSEFHKGLLTSNSSFSKRFEKFDNLIKKYQPKLDDTSMIDLMPMIFSMGSQFDHPNFSTPSNLKQQLNEPLRYSNNLDSLYEQYQHLTKDLPNENQFLNLTMLTIYANGLNWFKFNQILINALNRNDLQVLRMAAILISHLGSPVECLKFKFDYLPLLEGDEELEAHINSIIKKSNM